MANYLTCKAIERHVRLAWDGRQNGHKGYKGEQTDDTIAQGVAKALGHKVRPSSVTYVRKQLGMVIDRAAILTASDFIRLKEGLERYRKVVCLVDRKGSFRVYSLEKYTTGQARMAKAVRQYRPWEKRPKH